MTNLQEQVYREEYIPNGYREMWNSIDPDDMSAKSKLAELTPLLQYLAEALEALRDKDARKAQVALDRLYHEIPNRRRDIYRYRTFRHTPDESKAVVSRVAEAMLLITEVWELIKAVLDENEEEVRKEHADLNIRNYNLASRSGITDVDEAVREKHEINKQREKLHGRRI